MIPESKDFLSIGYLVDTNKSPWLIRCDDYHLYQRLYSKFSEEFAVTNYNFFETFRKWLIVNYKCYNDGTYATYFETEQDEMYCRLKI